MANMDVAGPDPNEEIKPCKLCGRKFAVSSLPRHEVVCKKNASKKRKAFDSGKQRATGSDIPIQAVKKVQQEIKQNKGQFKPPKTHWREKHEHFMSAVRAAKGVDFALKTGAPLPPPPKAVVPSDYVKCEHCGRNFSKAAADRHVPFCKEQKMRSGPIVTKQKKDNEPAKTFKPAPKKMPNKVPVERSNSSDVKLAVAPKSGLKSQSPSAGTVRSVNNAQNIRSASQGRTINGPAKTSMVPVPTTRKPSPARSATRSYK